MGHRASIRGIADRMQVEEKLRKDGDLYRTFINAAPDMVFMKDELFRNIAANIRPDNCRAGAARRA